MEQSQYADKWVQVYLALDVLSPWSCLCTQVDTLYMVKPNICWFILHGRDCGIIVICYESMTHEPECLHQMQKRFYKTALDQIARA